MAGLDEAVRFVCPMPIAAVMLPQVEAALKASKKPYKLIPVRFVEEGGTKMGHTVIMNWEAKVRSGLQCFPAAAATR